MPLCREARLREDLEDLTDDEEDQLLGIVPEQETPGEVTTRRDG